MPWIEGVGDEVTQFFGIMFIVLIGVIAWQSTGLSDRQIIRTVLILERRSRHRVHSEVPVPPTAGTTTSENNIDTGQVESPPITESQEDEVGVACHICDKENSSSPLASGSSESVNDPTWEFGETGSGDIITGSNVTVEEASLQNDNMRDSQDGNSSESALLRRRRLAFFQSRQTTLLENPIHDERNCPSTSSYGDHTTGTAMPTTEECHYAADTSTRSEESPSPGNIRIRLKYLNDDQKLVEGKLQEQLGDFKRRHFALEMAADKLVRLIFNGHVLQSDSETLQDCGLFDNCVVHCLVHQQRSMPNQTSEGTRRNATSSQANMGAADGHPQREWDLGNILFASLSIFVGLAWYCRFQYSQLFNTTTTVALVGLTGILTVSLVGLYLPDQDGVRH